MLLMEIEKEIQPLPRSDKLRLMQRLAAMLLKEEESEPKAEDYFEAGASYPVYTPTIAPDESAFAGALQLQELLEAQR